MADGATFKELSSDPGDLCRAYEEYIEALHAQLLELIYG
jgi:hypothetical protein